MPQIKLKYRKGEEVKYISHRDLMRAFQRAIRRAKLPIEYSQGFNPHMKISWGNALKVGTTSEEEFAVLTFSDSQPALGGSGWTKPQSAMEQLNQHLPKGLEITGAFLV